MSVDVWEKCHAGKYITKINHTAWRIVETQDKIATRKLVDTIEEQAELEEMIEASKPAFEFAKLGFHPLLYTPFRSPPLINGSRFGKKLESSLWYGSAAPETALAEKAYYQLAFINASSADFDPNPCSMTIFSIELRILRGLELNKQPFLKYQNQISSPTNYDVSQLLGKKMRESDIDGFTFVSARDKKQGINIGLFNMNSFKNKQPNSTSLQIWQCLTTKESVEFIGFANDQAITFPIKDFMIDEVFPFPSIT